MAIDNLCKYIAEQNPKAFAEWILNESVADVEVLKTELGIEPIRADSLTLLRGAGRILHLEFQTEPESRPPLPLRMLDYWVRLYRKYELPVTQTVLLLKETRTVVPEEFRAENITFRYRVLKIWEQDPQIFLRNKPLLPLAILAKTDEKMSLLQLVADRLQSIEEIELRRNLITQTHVLAGLRYHENLIDRILHEDFMKESVTYQRILNEGIAMGIPQGFKEGLKQGKDREASLVMRQLAKRVGTLDARTRKKIEALSFAQLEELGETLLDFTSKDDLKSWLAQQ